MDFTAVINAIHEDKALRKIHLTDIPLHKKDFELLVHALASQAGKLAVDELILDRNDMESVLDAVPVIENLPLLKMLQISRNGLEQDGLGELGKAIGTCVCLEELDLSRNALTASGLRALTNGLKNLTKLKQLRLRDNQIEADGAMAVTKLMTLYNAPVESLDFGLNNIGDSGAVALSHALSQTPTLKHLKIDCNYITMIGAEALAESLQLGSVLESLSIEDNRIGDEGVAALEEALEASDKLVELSTRGNKTMLSGTSI